MKKAYYDIVMLVEKLHRLFLDVVKVELDRMNITDINNVQCLVLYNIADSHLSVGELTSRGYYLGSNVSYNLRKMVKNGYVTQEASPHDRRSSRVKLSAKGLALYKQTGEIFDRHIKDLGSQGMAPERIQGVVDSLLKLESFWGNLVAQDMRI